MVALKSTSSRRPIPTPLHQPALHYLSEGLMGSADLQKDVEQLQLLVRRVEVDQRDDEDDRRAHPPAILREQQRSTGTTCVEVAGRTLLRPRKPTVRSAATRNRPKAARRAAEDERPWRRQWRGSSCAPRQTPLHPPPCCATVVQWLSDSTGERDRDQRGALRYTARPASAAPALSSCDRRHL
jgi:hypothetical protein